LHRIGSLVKVALFTSISAAAVGDLFLWAISGRLQQIDLGDEEAVHDYKRNDLEVGRNTVPLCQKLLLVVMHMASKTNSKIKLQSIFLGDRSSGSGLAS
jgi:hypothetical protein